MVSESNVKVSSLLRTLADLLELEGANEYRIRSYRQAAERIASLDRDVKFLIKQEKDLPSTIGMEEIPAQKIKQIIDTGQLKEIDDVKRRLPPIFVELLNLPGVRPEHVHKLYLEFNVDSLADLKAALANGALENLDNFDAQKVQNLKMYFEQKD